jgi:Spy/CpxP family protein refolding chaperone
MNDPIEKEEQGMKKLMVVALIVVFGALLSTVAVAAWTKGQGPGPDAQVDVNAFRNFQKETLPLRDEMAVKRLELRNEFSKTNPDQAKIAALKEEMIALRTQISDAAKKNGLPDRGFGPGYAGRGGYGRGGCGGYGPGGCDGSGPGVCAGSGPRCSSGGCPNR